MFSFLMLVIVFFGISIAVVTILGSILVASQYLKQRNVEDLYVSGVLAFGAMTDLGMIFSQVAFSLGSPLAHVGFKVFLLSILVCTILVWLHMSSIYKVKSKTVTALLSLASLLAVYCVLRAKVAITLQQGVIVPDGSGLAFVSGFLVISSIVGIEAVFAAMGLKNVEQEDRERFKISRTAGGLFFLFLASLIVYMFTKILVFYVVMWIFAFFAMMFLMLFSVVHNDSPVVREPLNFFRTRILFKLVITLVLMIVLSLEGMGIISINIAKRALSNSVIESYRNVVEDTISLIRRSGIDASSERNTLRSIEKILATTKIGDRGSVFLIAPSNNVYINRAKIWISLGRTGISDIGRRPGGEMNIFGEKVIAVLSSIPGTGWTIIVGQPISYAYSRLSQMEGTFIMFIFAWIALTIVVGIVLARNIEDPIKALKKGILKISEGDLDHKIHTGKMDELGELADTINRMTGELKESQASLLRSERLASLGFMATGMAHEIKNALVPLKTLTELLTVSGGDRAFISKFNELVPKEIDRISTLSTDLLHYSKPAEPNFGSVDPNALIEESVKFLEIQARKKSVKIVQKLSDVPEIRADRERIMEVLANLILNAIEAMQGGEITLSSYEKDEKVVIEVADNGPGISQENLEKIFVPFFTTKKEGTGMGLAITQRIMADHGGAIDVKSKQGEGTVFFLSFPEKSDIE